MYLVISTSHIFLHHDHIDLFVFLPIIQHTVGIDLRLIILIELKHEELETLSRGCLDIQACDLTLHILSSLAVLILWLLH